MNGVNPIRSFHPAPCQPVCVYTDTHFASPRCCFLVASPRVSPVSASHPPVIFWVKVFSSGWPPRLPWLDGEVGAGAEVLELERPWHSSQGPGPRVHTSAQKLPRTKEAVLGLRHQASETGLHTPFSTFGHGWSRVGPESSALCVQGLGDACLQSLWYQHSFLLRLCLDAAQALHHTVRGHRL